MHVIGRERGDGPTGWLGYYRARDGSRGEAVGIDLDGPHAAAVVGKRGSGKSYTLGVLAEAAARTEALAPVVADPMGVFPTLADTTDTGTDAVPAIVVDPLVRADALDPASWCRVLDLDPTEPVGTVVWQSAATATTLPEMRAAVAESDASAAARRGARNHLQLAASWGVFDPDATTTATLDAAAVTVLDLSGLSRAPMNAVLAAVARALYDARVRGDADRLPWLLVDEANAFFDSVAGPALRTLLTRGRQPGVSLVAATQRPAALPDVVFSQSDLVFAHRLTDSTDRDALAAARPSYATETFAARMPTRPGAVLVVDDATESVHAVQVRERATPHGGASPRASDIETVE